MNAAAAAMLLAVTFLVFTPAVPAAAQGGPSPATTDPVTVDISNAGTVGVVSGGVDGTYVRIAADLASVLDDGNRLRVLPLIGKGSVQNITDLLFLRGIDIAIVQSDVLAYIDRRQLFPNVQPRIDYIAKLYDEEVHVLARQDIPSLAALAHQKVNVDVRGSGTATTAAVIFGRLGIAIDAVNDDQDSALERLRRGDIAALVYVVGKPARLFTPLPDDSKLHFLSIPIDQDLLDTYLPSKLSHGDYPTLIADDASVDTVAVGAVMAVYNWAPNTERYRKVARFVDAFFSKFPLFQRAPRHPKWKDVNLMAQVPHWTRFPPAQEWLERQAVAGNAGGPLQVEFSTFLGNSGTSLIKLTDPQKTALFQQFLDWEKSRQKQ